MKYVRTGEFQTDALDKLHELQPKEEFTRSHLKRINLILDMVSEEYPDKLEGFISDLLANYKSIYKKNYKSILDNTNLPYRLY